MDVEAALLVGCPAAERVVGDQRARLDRAARLGVPAHLTVVYPFEPRLCDEDHRTLAELFGSFPAFVVRGGRTAWFDGDVLYVEPDDPAPLVALTGAVEAAFPAYRCYDGAYDDVVPHLTVGRDHPRGVLEAAERVVRGQLPFTEVVDHVELWSGPPVATAPAGSWRHVRDYRMDASDHRR